jgi:hypothetical protein
MGACFKTRPYIGFASQNLLEILNWQGLTIKNPVQMILSGIFIILIINQRSMDISR